MLRYAKDYCVPDEMLPDEPVESGGVLWCENRKAQQFCSSLWEGC